MGSRLAVATMNGGRWALRMAGVAGMIAVLAGCGDDEAPRQPLERHAVEVVVRDGGGTGRIVSDPPGIDCGEACRADFIGGRIVTLTATADEGSAFGGWPRPCARTGECYLVLAEDTTMVVTFVLTDVSP